MSKTKQNDTGQEPVDTGTAAEDTAAAPAAPAPDERDEQIAALRRELAAARNSSPAREPELDARDETIRRLREELDEIRSTPEGEAGELRKAFASLQKTVERMAAGQGLVPLPTPERPDPIAYGVLLGCGHTANAAHPNATHHHCEDHGTVPVTGHWLLSPEMRHAANA